jgi:hypothetical protein
MVNVALLFIVVGVKLIAAIVDVTAAMTWLRGLVD